MRNGSTTWVGEFGWLAALATSALGIVAAIWHLRRSRGMVQRWASQGGMELLSAQRRYLRRGPFWWRTSKNQEVFHVTVRNADGHVRTAYVRVGGWFGGLLSDRTDVEWDD